MSSDAQIIDVTDSKDVLDLAEEVHRSGVGRVLKRGEQVLALLTPVVPPQPVRSSRPALGEEHETLLDIIGIAASAEPTDIARYEQEYLAEAYTPGRE